MNKTYRLIWSETRQTWLVAHEAASASGKPSRSTRVKPIVAALAGALASLPVAAQTSPSPGTLPSGGQVVAGQAAISQAGTAMTIQQDSAKAILNWNSFSIGSQASVQFNQPSAGAMALNRVMGSDPSAIYGSLKANGQVFLLNPNGVVFGQGARVDVAGLVASTLNMRDEDFLLGNYRFNRDNAAAGVLNQGELLGKYVALLAPEVRNQGVIVARQGTAALAAGDAVTLNIAGSNLLGVQVDKASIDALVENRNLVQAEGGMVVLSAQAAKGLVGKVVNTGTIEAGGISTDGGVVRLLASSAIEHSGSIKADAGANGKGGEVIVLADLANPESRTSIGGSISAKGGSESGDGGFIETSGSHLHIADSARINTSAVRGRRGQWLLDPYDFTIAAVGGDITGSALSTALNSTDVTIQTLDASAGCTGATCSAGTDKGMSDGGDIFVNDRINWGSGTTLTLSAWRNIYINAPVDGTDNNGAGTGTGTGKLELQVGQNDFGFFGMGTYFVNAPVTLAAGANFKTVLGKQGDIAFPAIEDNYTVLDSKAGLQAMTTGNDATVRYALGRDIDATGGWTPIGTAGSTFNGYFDGLGHVVRNLSIANTTNQQYVGLFGAIGSMALVQNLGVVDANVAGLAHVGALAGDNAGWLQNVYATGSVTGSDVVGNTTDSDVYAIGGLVGSNSGGGLVKSTHANVTVSATTGKQDTGGTTNGGIGGLVGVNGNVIDNSSAFGNVTGIRNVGGLVGTDNDAFVSQSYAAGTASGSTNVGGVIGEIFNQAFGQPRLASTYWISDDAGTSSPSDGFNPSVRLSTSAAKQSANWSGFDFTNEKTWLLREGESYPLLTSMLQPIFVYATNTTTTYSGLPVTNGGATVSPGTATDSHYSGTPMSAPTTSAINAGTYTLAPSGLTLIDPASQLGYRFENVNGVLTIDPATLTYTANAASRAFGAANPTFTGTVTGFVNGETQGTATTGTLAFSSTANAASSVGNYAITGSGLTANNGNYTFAQAAGNSTALTINAAALSLDTTASKTYDGTNIFNHTHSYTLTGMVNGDAAPLVTSGTATVSSANTGTYNSFLTNDLVLSNSNYTLTGGTISATIDPATLTYTANAASRTYGAANPSFSGTVTGFVNGETLGSATTGSAAFGSTAHASSRVGSYAINGSGLTANNGNYVFAQASGNNTALTINPATLTYTANSASRTYGAANPSFSGTVTGFVNSETLGSATTGSAVFASTANASSNVGSYAITGSGLTANNGNYTFEQASGNNAALTINPALLTYTANAASRTYGDANPSFSGTVTGFVNGQTQGTATTGALAFTSAAVANTDVGSQAIIGSGLTANNGNYTFAQAAGNSTALSITARALSLLDLTFTGTPSSSTATSVASGDSVVLSSGSIASGALLSGDSVSVAFNPDNSTAKTVTVQSVTSQSGQQFEVAAGKPAALGLTGADAGNYTLTGSSIRARITAAAASSSSTDNTVTTVINSAQTKPPVTTTTAQPSTTTTTAQPTTAEPTTTSPQTTTTTAPPPAQVEARTTNPTPQPGQAVPLRVPSSSGSPALDASKPVAAVLVPADGGADVPAPTPKITQNADGTMTVEVTVPPSTPPGVYIIAVVGTDATGQSRVVIVPVVVRRRVAA